MVKMCRDQSKTQPQQKALEHACNHTYAMTAMQSKGLCMLRNSIACNAAMLHWPSPHNDMGTSCRSHQQDFTIAMLCHSKHNVIPGACEGLRQDDLVHPLLHTLPPSTGASPANQLGAPALPPPAAPSIPAPEPPPWRPFSPPVSLPSAQPSPASCHVTAPGQLPACLASWI